MVAPSQRGMAPMQMIANETAQAEASAPFSLTASDGSGLALTRIDAKAVIQGPLAFTELHLYFKNPESRVREGTFAITLPSGAAVSRFAMEINGTFQEAEVIEKQVARRVYDDFLHRKQDPALLEKGAGNQFTAKVFPIPANAEKHLVLSFSQELAGRGYVLPLRGLPTTKQVDVQLVLTGADGKPANQTLSKKDWQPDADFLGNAGQPAAAVAAGELVAASFSVAPRSELGGSKPTAMTILVDTSASRSMGFGRYVRSIREMVGAIATKYGAVDLQVVAFDQDTQVIYEGPAASYGDAQDRLFIGRGAAGASDLGQALAAVKALRSRVVVVTDAVMTAGPDTAALGETIKKLPIARVDIVLSGGIRDERTASTIARAGLPQAGDVFDLDRGTQTVVTGLGETVLTDIAIDVPGATWFYPRTIPAARPGSPLMVYARMARPGQEITINVGGKNSTIGLGSAAPALVERAVASAEIEQMENQLVATTDAAAATKLRDDIAKRSVKARVISSQTSMLVLETEADYERYKIPRTALADILAIGPNGLEQQKRTSFLALNDTPRPPRQPTREQTQTAREEAITRSGSAGPRSGAEGTAEVIDQARSAGVLGTTALQEGGAFASLTGESDISSEFDDRNVYGGLLGTEGGEMNGSFGFGRSGVGPGGGGSGWGTIGEGRYGTIGHGSGTGSGYGIGSGRGGMRGRSASVPTVSIGQPNVVGDLDKAIIRRYIKRNIQKITYCYEKQLLASPTLAGTVATQFVITKDGTVATVSAHGVHTDVSSCIADVIKNIEFPKPRNNANVVVNYPFSFRPSEGGGSSSWSSRQPRDPNAWVPGTPSAADRWSGALNNNNRNNTNYDAPIAPLTGTLNDVTKALETSPTKAFEIASKWQSESPGDVLALIALGEVFEHQKNIAQAARIYGSIIDLFPTRADMRRFAGERLERLGNARGLIVDTYRRAVADRPDHATGHRLLAYAHVRNNDFASAFSAILAGVDQKYPSGRFAGADRVMREDAGMIAAAYLAHGGEKDAVMAELQKRGLTVISKPSTRFIMYWETDSNDVDFHIKDAKGGHASYQNMSLDSGGELYADITTGYGPECFAIQGTPTAGPYELSINYYSKGPMGYGMGLLQVSRFNGKDFAIDDRPYIVMNDRAFVELGSYR